ncbi:hypothetical protein I215_01160 [Galbibacter marinus]|uniref:Glutamyl-tRNA synthetase n=1 Tax=Galbibacter marinus TaxID=555500 RepID=K2PVV1_9FLAO|nr:DUF4175 family protein [Galbibacter marinus]EKF56780.1 hypothetical protein I215_01160 [Galbibacter marinus]
MSILNEIHHKLALFLRKYYSNELLKGLFLFISVGLLYFIGIVLLEYFLWLSTSSRRVLFWAFVAIEVLLFIKFICIPLLYLFRLRKGIDHKEASKIIGNHFPSVGDKLLNFLQLSKDKTQSDLLLASIEQKGNDLKPIPFQMAISYKRNLKYAYYAAIPVVLILLVTIIGKMNLFTDSYKRVVDYQTAYAPPAPFEFLITNDSLKTLKGKSFTLEVETQGSRVPEDIQIVIGENRFFMEKSSTTIHQYTFVQPIEDIEFQLQATGVNSIPYQLKVIPTPSLLSFEMTLNYPNYTGKSTDTLKSTGNATILEGTEIHWVFNSENTDKISMALLDSTHVLSKSQQQFSLKKRIYDNTSYSVATSNDYLIDYEKLNFNLEVIKDQYPTITVKEHIDSSAVNRKIYTGSLSDDYGITKLEIFYKATDSDSLLKRNIPIIGQTVDRFVYEFPTGLTLKESVDYQYYFQVTDNDAIRGGKVSKSQQFHYRKLSHSELQQEQLKNQKQTIQQLQNTFEQSEEQKQQLNEINAINKQKNQLNFNDKKKIDQFLSRQLEQNQMMEKFQNKLIENLSEFQKTNKEKSQFNDLLKERLERRQKQLEENEKMMEELSKLADKIKKEEFSKRLEDMAKNQNNNSRSLEQILELTKRYYVQAKAEKLKNDILSLSERQSELAKKENSSSDDQQRLNAEFDKIQQELELLEKENKLLKKPMDLTRDEPMEEQIKQQQKQAKEKLDQGASKTDAKNHQKKAAEKLQQLGSQMKNQMQSGSQESLQEDADMLRQILDNLVLFSLKQESLMQRIGVLKESNTNLSVYLKEQNDLKSVFEHVDDSLFTLSLRQPKLTEQINKDVNDVYYNIDKSLEEFAENQTYQGVSYQQYALTATNSLADFLSNILDNMQESLSMGSGEGTKDFQLPDIIQSQEQLNKSMQDAMGKQQENKQNDNKGEPSQGENGEEMSEKLFEIYKEQQFLRNALEGQMDKLQNPSDKLNTKKAIEEMKQLENDLIEKGFTRDNEQKMLQLQHQLLKLENAAMQQGEKPERESTTNDQNFTNPIENLNPDIQQYLNEVEILNRQSLPLRQIYKEKVNTYFKTDD